MDEAIYLDHKVYNRHPIFFGTDVVKTTDVLLSKTDVVFGSRTDVF